MSIWPNNHQECYSESAAEQLFQDVMHEHLTVAQQTQAALQADFTKLLKISLSVLQAGGKIMFFGNGGSAADAQHLATELTVRFSKNRVAIPALALTTDSSTLTAIGNDLGFDHLFSRQIEALGKPGDLVIAISTSGQSPNIIKALQVAQQNGLHTAAFGGGNGGQMIHHTDIALIVPSYTVGRIQEMHITLGQILCSGIERQLGLVD